ncbi:MAG TPA: hypothetical protein VK724_24485 [Bryobacteraceae bacterium]|jgi:hypothetical protein|nr:hypothetical protein [Bryobacteraceae bacterium]
MLRTFRLATHLKELAKFQATYLFLAALVIGAGTANGADVKVIANSSVGASSVSSDELKGVFLATKSSLSDGSHVEPVLLKSGAVHEAFLKDYVGKTDSALETYYRSLVFTGKGSMPKAFATDAEVVGYVEKTKGAIGYVAAGTSTASAKVLEVK